MNASSDLSVAVITMVRDEADMLPRWLGYYGDEVGLENLVVLDDNSVDGSTVGLPCTVHRLPPTHRKRTWGFARAAVVNGIARGLLAYYDAVIYTDVDEFLVPDPALHDGLLAYVRSRKDFEVLAPIGLNVLHSRALEPDLDPDRPVLEQRRFVKFAPDMCKPLIKTVAKAWGPGFHGIKAPFEIDRELALLHLKFVDTQHLRSTAERRHRIHQEERRGSASSFWPVGADKLITQLSSWVEAASGPKVPEFDPERQPLEGVVRMGANGARASVTTTQSMADSPLMRLPERFRKAF